MFCKRLDTKFTSVGMYESALHEDICFYNLNILTQF